MITVDGAAAPGQREPAWRRWLGWSSVLVVLIGIAGAAVAMVVAAAPGHRPIPWIAVGVLAASAVVAVVLAIQSRTARAHHLAALCSAVLVVAAVVLLAVGPQWAIGSKLRQAEPGISRAADAVLADPDALPAGQHCGTPQADLGQIDDVLAVDAICITSSTPYGRELQVERRYGDVYAGLIYSPDRARPAVMSKCLRHVEGSWWEYSAGELNCPFGFTFMGGG